MPRGVTSEEFAQAADALLAAGERPTVERVRLALGRGSPNSMGPMLDAWWAQLAERLRRHASLPDVPESVASVFSQAWALALAAGHEHAETLIAPERAALADVVTQADTAVAEAQSRTAALERRLLDAEAATKEQYHAWLVSDQQVGQLGRQSAALVAQVQDLTVRRDALEARLQHALQQAQDERVAAAAERDAGQAHLRQVEDRAYSEVDRLRQEVKALKTKLATQVREHAGALKASEHARRAAESAMHVAQRQVAALQARVEVLSAQATRTAPRRAAAKKRAVRPKRAAEG